MVAFFNQQPLGERAAKRLQLLRRVARRERRGEQVERSIFHLRRGKAFSFGRAADRIGNGGEAFTRREREKVFLRSAVSVTVYIGQGLFNVGVEQAVQHRAVVAWNHGAGGVQRSGGFVRRKQGEKPLPVFADGAGGDGGSAVVEHPWLAAPAEPFRLLAPSPAVAVIKHGGDDVVRKRKIGFDAQFKLAGQRLLALVLPGDFQPRCQFAARRFLCRSAKGRTRKRRPTRSGRSIEKLQRESHSVTSSQLRKKV